MKKIDTSAITSGNWMPVPGNYGGNNFVNGSPDASLAGLDFLQQAYFECLNALSQFIVNDQTQPTIMYIAPPPPSNGPYVAAPIATEGFMNYMGEIYYFTFPNQLAFRIDSGPQYQNASIVTDFSPCDPVTFSDSSKYNVHQVRQVQFSWSGTRNAGNLPDYDLWLNASTNSYANILAQVSLNSWIYGTYNSFVATYNSFVTPTVVQVGISLGAPEFGTGWANGLGIPHRLLNTPSPLSYYLMWNRVYLWGEITYTGGVSGESTIFRFPSACYPLAYEEVFEVWDTTSQSVVGGSNASPPYYLVITNDGYVKLLYNGTGPITITLSGISFTQGTYTALTISLDEEISHTMDTEMEME